MAFPVIKTKAAAKTVVHSVGTPSKMPGLSWGLNADACHRGSAMARVPGSICSQCYAQKGHYVIYPDAKNAQNKRLEAFSHAETDLWVAAMVRLIQGQEAFRWFDSGDLQSPQMLLAIIAVARYTPDTLHWVATREQGYVRRALILLDGGLPDNIVVRVSADFIGQKPVNRVTPWSSTVHAANDPDTVVEGAYVCPAPEQGNKCGSCRACWDRDVETVSYKAH